MGQPCLNNTVTINLRSSDSRRLIASFSLMHRCMRSVFNPGFNIRFDRTTGIKGQTIELKMLDEIMCNFIGLSIHVIIELCSQFLFFFFFFFFQNKNFIIVFLHFLLFSKPLLVLIRVTN